ncbi:hypothetical protein BN1708_019763, partial [Verticillium longisporum]
NERGCAQTAGRVAKRNRRGGAPQLPHSLLHARE